MRKIRDIVRLVTAILFGWLYIPHLLVFAMGGGKKRLIISDLEKIEYQAGINGLPKWLILLDMLHNNRYYRVLFYHRVGAARAALMEWYRPGDKYFRIRSGMKIGEGMWIAHPYSTILNAESIGKNFRCIHCTTLGAGKNGIPTIGDNVSLGANVVIVGGVRIGNNVTIGAGSVVVKDIPDNSVAVGNSDTENPTDIEDKVTTMSYLTKADVSRVKIGIFALVPDIERALFGMSKQELKKKRLNVARLLKENFEEIKNKDAIKRMQAFIDE